MVGSLGPLYWPRLNFHGVSFKPTTSLVSKELGVKLGQCKETEIPTGCSVSVFG